MQNCASRCRRLFLDLSCSPLGRFDCFAGGDHVGDMVAPKQRFDPGAGSRSGSVSSRVAWSVGFLRAVRDRVRIDDVLVDFLYSDREGNGFSSLWDLSHSRHSRHFLNCSDCSRYTSSKPVFHVGGATSVQHSGPRAVELKLIKHKHSTRAMAVTGRNKHCVSPWSTSTFGSQR